MYTVYMCVCYCCSVAATEEVPSPVISLTDALQVSHTHTTPTPHPHLVSLFIIG